MRGQPFKPIKRPGRKDYQVQFFHPLEGKFVTRGLGTQDSREAQLAAAELEKICLNKHLHSLNNSILAAFDFRAVRAFFGRSADMNFSTFAEAMASIVVLSAYSIRVQQSSFLVIEQQISYKNPSVAKDIKDEFLLHLRTALSSIGIMEQWGVSKILEQQAPSLAETAWTALAKAEQCWRALQEQVVVPDRIAYLWDEFQKNMNSCLVCVADTLMISFISKLHEQKKKPRNTKKSPRRAP
ncbi:MAG: hypothetical protein AMXMBFR7_25600 [Planctomycetota bacterium]